MQGNPPAKGNCLTAGGCAHTRRRSVGMGLVRVFLRIEITSKRHSSRGETPKFFTRGKRLFWERSHETEKSERVQFKGYGNLKEILNKRGRVSCEFKSRLLQNVTVREVKLQSSLHGANVFFKRAVTRPKKVNGCSSKATVPKLYYSFDSIDTVDCKKKHLDVLYVRVVNCLLNISTRPLGTNAT
jgi:hypothetical protein